MRQFLNALDRSDARFAFRTIKDHGDGPTIMFDGGPDFMTQSNGEKRGKRWCTPSRLMLSQTHGDGVFVTINETNGCGAKAEHINRVRALFAEGDTAKQVDGLRAFMVLVPPSLVVESGGLIRLPDGTTIPKLHVYWLVDGCPVDQFKAAQELLISRANSDPVITDLPRVMRLPGFRHMKHAPRMTRIIIQNDFRYEYPDLLARIKDAPQVRALSSSQNRIHRLQPNVGAPTASPAIRDRLRVLLERHDGRIRNAIAALLAEARGPSDAGGGNRHHTLISTVGYLVHQDWPDLAIHACVTVTANNLWGGDDRRARVQSMIDNFRGRERARMPAAPSQRMAALSRAFGGARA
jgi:hypothetical protein